MALLLCSGLIQTKFDSKEFSRAGAQQSTMGKNILISNYWMRLSIIWSSSEQLDDTKAEFINYFIIDSKYILV